METSIHGGSHTGLSSSCVWSLEDDLQVLNFNFPAASQHLTFDMEIWNTRKQCSTVRLSYCQSSELHQQLD